MIDEELDSGVARVLDSIAVLLRRTEAGETEFELARRRLEAIARAGRRPTVEAVSAYTAGRDLDPERQAWLVDTWTAICAELN